MKLHPPWKRMVVRTTATTLLAIGSIFGLFAACGGETLNDVGDLPERDASSSGSGGIGGTGGAGVSGTPTTGGSAGVGGASSVGGTTGSGGSTGGAGGGGGGTPASGGGSGGSGGTGGIAGATATLWQGVPASEIPSPESLCAQQEQTVLAPCSPAEYEALLVGRWWMCSGTSPVPDAAAIGIEFASTGDWYGLVLAGDGTLQRDSGFDGQGRWELYAPSNCVDQLNINLTTGFIPSSPAFADGPRKLDLGTGLGYDPPPRYVAVP
jgi:hypothetical protein